MSQKGIIKNSTTVDCSAKEMANLLMGILQQSGITGAFNGLACTKVDNNTVRLASGVYSLSGYMLEVEPGTTLDLTVDSGTAEYNRIDSVVAEFVRDGGGSGIDTLQFKVVKGTPTTGTPSSPALTQQDINGSGTTRQEELYMVNIAGTSITSIIASNAYDTIYRVLGLSDGSAAMLGGYTHDDFWKMYEDIPNCTNLDTLMTTGPFNCSPGVTGNPRGAAGSVIGFVLKYGTIGIQICWAQHASNPGVSLLYKRNWWNSGANWTDWTVLRSETLLETSTSWAPGSIAAGATAVKNVTLTGVALTDFVDMPSCTDTLGGLFLEAYVSAANTIQMKLYNPSGTAYDIGSQTFYIRAHKRV